MKYIIGGGIAGLIFAFYNKNYKILTPDIGGQMQNGFSLGPRFLHKTEETKMLLDTLNIKYKIKTYKVCYLYNNKIHDSCPKKLLKVYAKKTYRKVTKNEEQSIMNSNKNKCEYYDINWNILIKKLQKHCKKRIILCKVNKININKKQILIKKTKGKEHMLKYNNIVSTVAAPIFYGLIGDNITKTKIEKNLKPITYIYYKNAKQSKKYDFCYCIDNKTKFYRITKYKNGLVYEYVGSDKCNKNLTNHKCLWYGKILCNMKLKEPENITFLGRYAEMQHNIKIEQIIRMSTIIFRG